MSYKEKIKQGLKSGEITYKNTTVMFECGRRIGGVLANNQEDLIDIIEKCLYRADFSVPDCLQ